jgi:hypothetical protein
MTMTAIPHTTVIPGNVTAPPFSLFTTMAAMPANNRKNVENNSARSYVRTQTSITKASVG